MRRHGIENVGVVRASVLDMPLADGAVDYAFSIGVLQHTGNAPKMIAEMARIVPPGNHISINCYGRGSALYEAVDAVIRKYTTKMDQAKKLDFARKVAAFDRKMLMGPAPVRFLEKRLRRMMVLRPTVVQMYDWYAPEIAEHYTPEDLKPIFATNGLEIVAATHRITDPGYSDRRRKRRADPYSFLLRKAAA
jgi:ubiquinone/menaquinone biosynthesis C-methylase UbiE